MENYIKVNIYKVDNKEHILSKEYEDENNKKIYYDICFGDIYKQCLEEESKYLIEFIFYKQGKEEKKTTTQIYIDCGCVRVIEENYLCTMDELTSTTFEDRLGFAFGEKTLEEVYSDIEQEIEEAEEKKTRQAFKTFLS